jgi:hypothetical protein
MTFPGGNQTGRAVSLTPWGVADLLMPLWPNKAAYGFSASGNAVVVTPVPVPVFALPLLRPGAPGSITDSNGLIYELTSDEHMTVNGQEIGDSAGTVALTYVSGTIWAESDTFNTGDWFTYSPATSGFTPMAPAQPPGWNGVSSLTVDSTPGYAGAVSDASGNAWLAPYNGPLTFVPGDGSFGTLYPMPLTASGTITTDIVMLNDVPYVVTTSGSIYGLSGSIVVPITGSFGGLTRGAAADTSNIYALLPQTKQMGVFSFSAPFSGSVAKHTTPMDVPAFVVSGPNGTAIGGWSQSTFSFVTTAVDLSPASGFAAAVTSGTGDLTLLTGHDPSWTVVQTVSGLTGPADVAWANAGTQVLVTEPSANHVAIYNLITGTLTFDINLSVSGATNIAILTTDSQALVSQSSHNQVSLITSEVNNWVVSSVVTGIAAASDIAIVSDTEALVACASGVAFLSFNTGTWGVSKLVSGLPYNPTGMDWFIDTDGLITAVTAGVVGASGRVDLVKTTGLGASGSWAGSAGEVLWRQGQIAIADPSNDVVRVFGEVGASLRSMGTNAGPDGVATIGQTGTSLWLGGSAATWQSRFTAPYKIVPYNHGYVATWDGSSFTTVDLGVEHQPSAGVWGPSGVWVATTQNDLYVINDGILVQQLILPADPQPAGVPLGMSEFQFWNGELYASSSLNNGLMALAPAQASGAPVPPSNLVLALSGAAATSVGLTWNVPAGTPPFSYETFYRVGSLGSFSLYASGTATSLLVSGLSGNTNYNFAVSGINEAGHTTSNILSAQTQPTIGSPTLTGTLGASGVENLSWTVPSGAQPINYQPFFQDTTLGSTWTPFGGVTSQTSTQIGNLTAGHTYNFAVSGINSTGNNVSNTVTQLVPGPPDAPVLSVTQINSSSVAASWNLVANAINYQMQLGPVTHGSPTFVNYGGPLSNTTTSITVSGLNPLTTYSFRVVATSAGGSTNSNVVTLNAATTPPTSIAFTGVSGVTNSSALLGYVVCGGSTPITTQFRGTNETNSIVANMATTTATSGSVLINGLFPDTSYAFVATAQNSAGIVITSQGVGLTTKALAAASGTQVATFSPSGQTPVFVGPTGLTVAPGMTIALNGISVFDEPTSDTVILVNTNWDNATVFATSSGVPCQGAGTGGPDGGMAIPSTSSGLDINGINAALATLTYTAPPNGSGITSDVIQILGFDSNTPSGSPTVPNISIAVTITSGVASGFPVSGYSQYHPSAYTNPGSGQALLLPQGYLSTSGNQFVDPNNGNLPVRIMGANYAGMEFGNALNTESDPSSIPFCTWQVSYKVFFKSLVQNGINAIRWNYCDAGLAGTPPMSTDGANFSINTTVNPDLAGKTVLEIIDTMLAYCAEIGLKVWFGRMWQNPTVGQTTLPYGTPSGIGSLVNWTQQAVIDNMVMLAQRYANNPTVIGFELNNEIFSPPCTWGDGNPDTDVRLWWQNAGNAILAVNPNVLIICQAYGILTPPPFSADGGTIADLSPFTQFPVALTIPNKLAFSVHSYEPSINSGPQQPATWNPYWGFLYSSNTVPILMTEYGYLAADIASGAPNFASTQAWVSRLTTYVTAGTSGSISGIPAGGYPPSMTWFCADASGPTEGDGASVDNSGFCLVAAADWTTILPGQFAWLPPVMFYRK